MKKAKKILLSILSLVLVAVLSIAGTLAYLKDEDSDYNVMTMGNVKIDQIEYERVVENGSWVSTGETDKYGYIPDEIQEFTQDKPLYPAVYANEENTMIWDDRNGSSEPSGEGSHQQSWGQIGAPGSNQLFDDSVRNVQDKFVFVKNTGKSDAYVRTWFAFEAGGLESDAIKNDMPIHINSDLDHWKEITYLEEIQVIDGTEYIVGYTTYLGPTSNPTGILAPGATSYASLLQVYLDPTATNEVVAELDSNDNGKYDILVFSQATQTKGFSNAEEALTTSFGTEHPWVNYDFSNSVTTAEELEEAVKTKSYVKLESDIVLTDLVGTKFGSNVTLDLNGHKISRVDNNKAGIMPGFNATFTIEGEGYINFSIIYLTNAFSEIVLKGGTYIQDPSTQLTIAEGYKVVENQDGTYSVVAE